MSETLIYITFNGPPGKDVVLNIVGDIDEGDGVLRFPLTNKQLKNIAIDSVTALTRAD